MTLSFLVVCVKTKKGDTSAVTEAPSGGVSWNQKKDTVGASLAFLVVKFGTKLHPIISLLLLKYTIGGPNLKYDDSKF